ncbi:MAG: hypothetical protein P1R58_07355 [bacterium]|nr:hypothetical protein [bacterium]
MNDKKAKLKEVAPHIWSMYQHLMSGRSALENRLSYFLAINALLLIGFLQFFQLEVEAMEWEYVVPCIVLIIPIVLLLMNFLARQMRGAWMDFDNHKFDEPILETIKKDEFYERWIANMFSHAEGSWKYRKRIHKLLRFCVACILSALTWLLLLLLCCSAKDATQYLFVIITSATVGILVYAIPEQLKDFPYRDRESRVRSEINKWLS